MITCRVCVLELDDEWLFKEAIELFKKMQMGDVHPNYVTLVSVLPAISRLGALELGEWVHFYAVRNKIKIDVALGSALIDVYSKCGRIENALRLFERLPRKMLSLGML